MSVPEWREAEGDGTPVQLQLLKNPPPSPKSNSTSTEIKDLMLFFIICFQHSETLRRSCEMLSNLSEYAVKVLCSEQQ